MKVCQSLFASAGLRLLVSALGTGLTIASLTAQSRTVTVDDLRLEIGVNSVALSDDGTAVAVITSRPNYEDNRFDRTLLRVDTSTGRQTTLTTGRPGVSQPRWSPSGDRLAFLDAGKDGGSRQIYVLRSTGGEARQVTQVMSGVNEYRWTTDGNGFLFTSTDTPKRGEGEERHNRSFEVGDNSYLTRQGFVPVHLWRVPSEGGEPKRLTDGEVRISNLNLSPDGHTVAFSLESPPRDNRRPDVIRTLNLESGEARDLVSGLWTDPGAFSPDGRFLALIRPTGAEPGYTPNGLFLKPMSGGPPIHATARLDRWVFSGIAWLPDGRSLLVTGVDFTQGAMWEQPLDGSARRLDLGTVSPSAPVVSGNGTVVFVGREPLRPSEVYVMRTGEWRPRRLTNFNDAIASMQLGRVETVRWDGPDGFKENGVLLYPPGFQLGRRYPLVLNIHGGPYAGSTEAFDAFNHVRAVHLQRYAA